MSLVCWSGGLDSTLVLHTIATEQRNGSMHHASGIRALTVNHPQVACHLPSAKAAREALKEKFRNSGFIISYLEVDVTQSLNGWRPEQGMGDCENPQALLWLTFALNYLERNEDLYSGYIKGDDYWHSASRYSDVFDSLQAIQGRTGKLRHPLEWLSKADVIREAKSLALYDLCWWCEEEKCVRGKVRPCGVCKSCQTNDTALWQLSQKKWNRDAPVVCVRGGG